MSSQKSLERFARFAREELFRAFRAELQTYDLHSASAPISTSTSAPATATATATATAMAGRLRALGFAATLEEVSYTWFNRLVTLRYFELHAILPAQLSSHFWHSPETLLSACQAAADFLPALFAGQTQYCDTLTLDFFFQPAGIIEELLALPAEAFQETEVLGWFYQYYNSTRRKSVVAAKRPYTKLEIPVATQLFTPAWISEFLVENSLGRLYAERGKNSVLTLAELRQVTLLDPCCGSGHLLAQAFRKFYTLYAATGVPSSEIPQEILAHNLFGLDVDTRAVQIATTVLLLTAYEFDYEIFQKPIAQHLHIYDIPESNSVGKTYVDNISDLTARAEAQALFDFFVEAKNFGSLLTPPHQTFTNLKKFLSAEQATLSTSKSKISSKISSATLRRQQVLQPMLDVYEMLADHYDIVVTNPPYLASGAMNQLLKDFVAQNYPHYKRDLFAAFTFRCLQFLRTKNSYLGLMTPSSWLCTAQFQPFRQDILQNYCIKVLIQPYNHAFFSYAAVEICAFVLKNQLESESEFLHLTLPGDMSIQAENFRAGHYEKFQRDQKIFLDFPEQKIIYWLDDQMAQTFTTADSLATFAELKSGIATGQNQQFLRHWYEIPPRQFGKKWLPHNKGGGYRKWYGNRDYVFNWSNSVAELKQRKRSKSRDSRPQNLDYNFRSAISWSAIGDGKFSARFYDESFSFNAAAPSCFPAHEGDQKYLLGFLNSCVAQKFITALNPTLNLNPGDLAKLPIVFDDDVRPRVEELVTENLQLARADYDSFESSWDFQIHPLLVDSFADLRTFARANRPAKLADAFQKWQVTTEKRFARLQQNETELNQIFIKLYQLENILDPTVPDENISLRLADQSREIKTLLSFFVGFSFGRFTLPTLRRPRTNVLELTELPPRFKNFLQNCFQPSAAQENLTYVAETLGTTINERPADTILRYFTEQFYTDHLRVYHNLPIYWQIDSGPEHAFRALLYYPNYQPESLAVLQQRAAVTLKTYESQQQELSNQFAAATWQGNQRWIAGRQQHLLAKIAELQNFQTKLSALQAENWQPNYDAGIRANYQHLQAILAKLLKS